MNFALFKIFFKELSALNVSHKYGWEIVHYIIQVSLAIHHLSLRAFTTILLRKKPNVENWKLIVFSNFTDNKMSYFIAKIVILVMFLPIKLYVFLITYAMHVKLNSLSALSCYTMISRNE